MRSRATRVTVWLAGYSAFLTLICVLIEQSTPRPLVEPGLWLLSVWGAVTLVLVLLPPDPLEQALGIRLALIRVAWLCVGAVVLAALLPGAARYLMLSVPFIGIAFASTRLSAADVLLVAALTWVGFGAAEGSLIEAGLSGWEGALLVFGIFSLALLAMLSSALEIVDVHSMLHQQRTGLQQHLDRLQVVALQDELTGLYNRRYAMEVLSRELAYAHREGVALSVCYCDLDHFKELNDRFGHASGDLALRAFANLALSLVRSVDYVARIGGEEFLLILAGSNADRARTIAERLCTGTRDIRDVTDTGVIRFTVSCGVTEYRSGEGAQGLLKRADEALYAAKRAGRDRVVVI